MHSQDRSLPGRDVIMSTFQCSGFQSQVMTWETCLPPKLFGSTSSAAALQVGDEHRLNSISRRPGLQEGGGLSTMLWSGPELIFLQLSSSSLPRELERVIFLSLCYADPLTQLRFCRFSISQWEATSSASPGFLQARLISKL